MNQTLLQKKIDGRKTALALLQKQLERGTKPISKGPKPGKNGHKEHVLKLTAEEIRQKEHDVLVLKNKIARNEKSLGGGLFQGKIQIA